MPRSRGIKAKESWHDHGLQHIGGHAAPVVCEDCPPERKSLAAEVSQRVSAEREAQWRSHPANRRDEDREYNGPTRRTALFHWN